MLTVRLRKKRKKKKSCTQYVLSLDYTSILKIHLSHRFSSSPADRQLAECNMGPYSRAGAPTVGAPAIEPSWLY